MILLEDFTPQPWPLTAVAAVDGRAAMRLPSLRPARVPGGGLTWDWRPWPGSRSRGGPAVRVYTRFGAGLRGRVGVGVHHLSRPVTW